jgi:hypothetical protein
MILPKSVELKEWGQLNLAFPNGQVKAIYLPMSEVVILREWMHAYGHGTVRVERSGDSEDPK